MALADGSDDSGNRRSGMVLADDSDNSNDRQGWIVQTDGSDDSDVCQSRMVLAGQEIGQGYWTLG